MKKLTPKQQCFVNEYLIDLNASAAARRAGYSVKTAEWIGQQLLGKTHVLEAIKASIQYRMERTKVTVDGVIERIIRLADAAEEKEQYAAALKAAELLGKHLGMFTEKFEVTGEAVIFDIH